MADLFWNVATSYTVLIMLAVIFIAAFCVAHIPVIGTLMPSLAPYLVAARLVSLLAAAALCFLIGFRMSDERAQNRQLKFDLQWTKAQLEQQKATADEKQQLAEQKAAEADHLKAQVDDYEAALAKQPADGCVLDDGDLDGLRALRQRAKRGHGANPKGLRGPGRASGAAGP